MKKVKFIIVGSGWRSLYYVRVAKALPDRFELCAMLCRSWEKADKMAAEHGIYTTTSIEECRRINPDFVLVAVNKTSIADVSIEWMGYGFTVLCETPAALEASQLEMLWKLHGEGRRLVVAEQYIRYPRCFSMLEVLKKNIIGEPCCMNISLAHDYHGASLMRAFLNVPADTGFTVAAKTYSFPTAETLNRYERFRDGRIKDKQRTIAVFEFEGGKTAWYDFDSEQYRSPIRSNYVRVQGVKGELKDNKISFLDEKYEFREAELLISENRIITQSSNPNLHEIKEVEKIVLQYDTKECETLYEPYFGKCGLTEDETAIAYLMKETAEYNEAASGNPDVNDETAKAVICRQKAALRNALQDAYMALLMQKAAESGKTVCSERCKWH